MVHAVALVAPGGTAVEMAPCMKATSDDATVSLWLRNYRSANAQCTYAADVRRFLGFVARPLRAVMLGDIQDYTDMLVRMAPASISRRLSAVKSLVPMADRLGYFAIDVGDVIQLPAIEHKLGEKILTEGQMRKLLAKASEPRNATLLTLIYGIGCRVSEACDLCWRDLQPQTGSGQVTVAGKGGKTRYNFMPAALWKRLDELHGDDGPDTAVFHSRAGLTLDRSHFLLIVKAAAKAAGLTAEVSPHSLRHAHVSHALDRGAPIHVVRESVGHASLETTTRDAHSPPDDGSARYLSTDDYE